MVEKDTPSSQALVRTDAGLTERHRQKDRDVIHDCVMRAGGEPFGAPFELGLHSLTEKIVRFLKQHSFFGFESLEVLRPRNLRNKFTRYGASRYRGPLKRGGRKIPIDR